MPGGGERAERVRRLWQSRQNVVSPSVLDTTLCLSSASGECATYAGGVCAPQIESVQCTTPTPWRAFTGRGISGGPILALRGHWRPRPGVRWAATCMRGRQKKSWYTTWLAALVCSRLVVRLARASESPCQRPVLGRALSACAVASGARSPRRSCWGLARDLGFGASAALRLVPGHTLDRWALHLVYSYTYTVIPAFVRRIKHD